MNSKKLFSYETLVHASAGAAGGITAMTVFFPLDTIRSRLQVEDSRKAKGTLSIIKDLIDEEGVASLYRGLQPVLISLCCSNFVYFYTFHGLRSLADSKHTSFSALRDLAVASVAGVINVVLTTPLWVANSRLKMQGAKISSEDQKRLGKYPAYNGIVDALRKISSMEGLPALWSSMVPSLMLIINPSIQFTVYETLKLEIPRLLGKNSLSSVEIFLLGALAKGIATVITYPLQIVQQKLRYGSKELKRLTTLQIFIHIIQNQGAKGLYKGLEPKLLQTACTAALMFLCYEKITAFVFQIMGISHASVRRSH